MKTFPHARQFTLYPLTQLAIALCAGIIASQFVVANRTLLIITAALFSLLSILSCVLKRLMFAGTSLLLAIAFLGSTLHVLDIHADDANSLRRLLSSAAPDKEWRVTGTLLRPPEFARDRMYLILNVESVDDAGCEFAVSGVVALIYSFERPEKERDFRELRLRYGTRVRVKTKLNRLDRYRNPGVSTLSEYLERKRYVASGSIRTASAVTVLGKTGTLSLFGWIYESRERVQRAIDTHFSVETAGVLDAALLGNGYNLSQAAAERFRAGGTFHVLVISGLHISFIGGLVFLLMRQVFRSRLLQFLTSAGTIWGYSIAVGAEASVVRAALMFTLMTLGALFYKSSSSLNLLGGAALILLVLSPREVFNPSFQLTFLSVLAIVVVAWPVLHNLSAIGGWKPTRATPYPPACSRALKTLAEILFWREQHWASEMTRSAHSYRLFKTPVAAWLEEFHLQRCLRYIFGAVVVSVSVQLTLLPFLIVYFHRVSFSSLVLNIGVSVLMAVVAIVAIAGLLLSQISASLAMPFIKLAEAMNYLMIHSVDPFTKLGLASLRLPEYSGGGRLVYVLYYVPLIVFVMWLLRWRPLSLVVGVRKRYNRASLLLASQLVLTAIVILHPFSSPRADGRLHLDFLDVGQGDAALVTMPDGTKLLIDGGGRPSFPTSSPGDNSTPTVERENRSIGETVVSEYLWWQGLDRIDYVLATHADADHIDGLNDVLRNFAVRGAIVARTPPGDREYARFAETLAATGTPVEVIHAGDLLRFGEVEARVLWPLASADRAAPSQNNDSVVLQLRFGQRLVLMTGDIERNAEQSLVNSGLDLRADLIKVPHHGSKTSSTAEFINAVRPSVAIVSVGQTSIFGHPHQEVLDRWKAAGVEVLTTGNSGTITVVTDGTNLSVNRFIN